MITDESIIQIAEQLGIATEHIYDVFVAAQPTVAMLQIACGIFIIGFMVLGYCLNYINEWDGDVTIIVFIFSVIGFVISIFLYECMKCLLLPEYTAIIKLMKLMTGCGP